MVRKSLILLLVLAFLYAEHKADKDLDSLNSVSSLLFYKRKYTASIRDTIKIYPFPDPAGPPGAISVDLPDTGYMVENRGDHFIFYTENLGTYRILFKKRGIGTEVSDTVFVTVTDNPPLVEIGKKKVFAVLNKNFDFGMDIKDDGDSVTILVDLEGDGKPDTACLGTLNPFFKFIRPTKSGELKKVFKTFITVIDNDSHYVYDSAEVCIYFKPPVAEAGDNIIVCREEGIIFSGKKCRDKNGYIKTFIWDFNGDGKIDTILTLPDVEWTFNEAKDYYTILWVEDNDRNRSRPDTVFVTVMEDLPRAHAGSPIETRVGEKVQFFGKGGSVCSEIEKYLWDFENDGRWDYISRGHGRTTFSYTKPGNYSALFMVVDSKNDSASQIRHIKIEP